MKKRFNVTLMFIGYLLSLPLWADQPCTDTIIKSTPDANFTINTDSNGAPDGTVTDNSTGLMWMRCSYGQTWSVDSNGDGSCSGDASPFTWQEALTSAEAYSSVGDGYSDYSDWRLPNIKELNSIVEEACVFPALNTRVFPGYINDYYWSASSSTGGSAAWKVGFVSGGNVDVSKSDYEFYDPMRYYSYARLVRAGQ